MADLAIPAAPPLTAADLAALTGPAAPQLLAALASDMSVEQPVSDAEQAVASATQQAASRQGGLAPLLADLVQAAATQTLPAPLQAAVSQLLASQTTLDETVTAADVKQALTQSGLFLEANLASGQAPPQGDLKSALLVLSQATSAWLGQPTGAQASRAAGRTPPPYRGAPTRAQPAARSSLSADSDAHDTARQLSAGADAALARQTLLQLASARRDNQPPSWLFEVPVTTPDGAAVAQFEITRDGASKDAQSQPVWRARFSVDVEPLGPVHAEVALRGAQASITLWAERPASAEALRDQVTALGDGLEQASFEARVSVLSGAPQRPAAAPGSFLDRSS